MNIVDFWSLVLFPLVFSCDWLGMVVLVQIWQPWCELLITTFRTLRCFEFFVFYENKVGSLSTSITTPESGPILGWIKFPSMLKTKQCPVPIAANLLPNCPRVQWNKSRLCTSRWDSCLLSLLCHFLESTGDISMWTIGPGLPSGSFQPRRKIARIQRAARLPRRRRQTSLTQKQPRLRL